MREFLWIIVFVAILNCFGCTAHIEEGVIKEIEVQSLMPSDYTPVNNIEFQTLSPDDIIRISYNFAYQMQEEAYQLQIKDVMSVKFPSLPNLNTTQTVKPDGKISLPYIGEFVISGKTMEEATQSIKKQYKGILWEAELFLELIEYGENIDELKKSTTSSNTGQTQRLRIGKDGKIALPMIGEIQAEKTTVSELTKSINKAYQQFFDNVSVTINMDTPATRYYYVLGEVRKPGMYTSSEIITALELLAMSGGTTPDSVLSKAVHMRVVDNVMTATRTDLKVMEKNGGQRLSYVKPGDILYVPRSDLSDLANVVQQVAQMVMFRGINYNINGWDVND